MARRNAVSMQSVARLQDPVGMLDAKFIKPSTFFCDPDKLTECPSPRDTMTTVSNLVRKCSGHDQEHRLHGRSDHNAPGEECLAAPAFLCFVLEAGDESDCSHTTGRSAPGHDPLRPCSNLCSPPASCGRTTPRRVMTTWSRAPPAPRSKAGEISYLCEGSRSRFDPHRWSS